MKKKLLALFAIVAFVAVPTFANTLTDMKTDASIKVSETSEKIFNNTTHPTWSAGLALGVNTGLAVSYRVNPQLTAEGVLGYNLAGSGFSFELEGYGMYKVTEFEINEAKFDVKAGAGAVVGWNSDIKLGVLAAGEVIYSFDDDFPIDLAFRLAPGLQILPSIGFTSEVALIGTYRFI